MIILFRRCLEYVPPEPEKPWWYHLIWALPCMAATAMLGYWLKKPGVREVEVIKEVKVTEQSIARIPSKCR